MSWLLRKRPPSPRRTAARISRRSGLRLLGALCGLGCAAGTASEGRGDDTNPLIVFSEVVVTSAATTSPLTVVTDPKAPRQPVPASDGADYLKTIPGFSLIRNGGTNGDPVLRGMFGSRLTILSDGGLILGACGSRMDNPTSYIAPESFDRLTVIKGPQTVRWGPVGSAGTVLFEREPQRLKHFTARADGSLLFGSRRRTDLRLDTTMGDRLGYARFIGNRSLANDYKDGSGRRVPSKWDKWNGDLFLGWTPDSDTVLELSAGTGDGEARYAGRAMDGTQFRRRSLAAKFLKTGIDAVADKLEAHIFYNDADHVMDNFRLRDPGSAALMESEPGRETLGGRVAATWEAATWEAATGETDALSLTAGVDGQTNTHRTANREAMRVTSGWSRNAVFRTVGLFGEATWSSDAGQRIVTGVRADVVHVADHRAASPTRNRHRTDILPGGFARYERDLAALPLTTYAGIGYTERFPDYWELFSPQTARAGSANAFEAVRTEKTVQLDMGGQYSDADSRLWVSAYIGHIGDYILFDYTGSRSAVANVDAAVMGGELGATRALTEAVKADVSLACAWGRNLTDRAPLPQMPPLETRLGLTWERDGWSLGALVRAVAPQNRIARNKGTVVGKDYGPSSGFVVLSLNGSTRITEAVRLTAGVDNLLNKTYSEHLNRDGDAGFGFAAYSRLREPGRTVWVRADFKL